MNPATAFLRVLLTSVTLTVLAAPVAAHNSGKREGYSSQVLVSNGSQPAPFTDPNLVNAWGIVFNPTGVVWVNNQGTGKSTLYDGNGVPQALVVTVPGPAAASPAIRAASCSRAARTSSSLTAFATVPRVSSSLRSRLHLGLGAERERRSTQQLVRVPRLRVQPLYTGLALGGNGTTHLLYAANFRTGRVDVFDGTFKPVEVPGGFRDRFAAKFYAPFGIQAINGDVYVTYAKPDPATGQSSARSRPRIRQRVRSGRPPAAQSREPRRPECAVGIGAGARELRQVRRCAARRQSRRRHASMRTGRVAASSSARCATLAAAACTWTACGDSRSATASSLRKATLCSSRPAPITGQTALTVRSPSPSRRSSMARCMRARDGAHACYLRRRIRLPAWRRMELCAANVSS